MHQRYSDQRQRERPVEVLEPTQVDRGGGPFFSRGVVEAAAAQPAGETEAGVDEDQSNSRKGRIGAAHPLLKNCVHLCIRPNTIVGEMCSYKSGDPNLHLVGQCFSSLFRSV